MHQADDLLFCYRWLLLEMKREFAFDDSLRMLEVLWSSLPADPPQIELKLFDTKFQPPISTPPISPLVKTPRENAYTKVCALRRQSSSISLVNYSAKKVPAVKRQNHSLDENVGRLKNIIIDNKKKHQSLDDTSLTHQKHYKTSSEHINSLPAKTLTSPKADELRPRSISPLESKSDSVVLNNQINAHKKALKIRSSSLSSSMTNLIKSSKKGGHFKELKEKIGVGKVGIFSSLDRLDMTNSIKEESELKETSGKVVKNFNEFLHFASMNKNRISDKLIKLGTSSNSMNENPKIYLTKSSFDDSESSSLDHNSSTVEKSRQFSTSNSCDDTFDDYSPDDSQDYFPLTTSVTKELRMEMENLDRHVFGNNIQQSLLESDSCSDNSNKLMTTRSRKLVSLAIQENQEICDRLLHLPRYETTKPSSKSEMLLYTKIFKDSEFASKIVSREVDLKNSPSNLVLRNELAEEYFAPQTVSQCSLHENDVALQNTELELNMDKNMAVLQTVKYFDIEPPSLHYFKDNDTNSTCSEEIRLQPEIVVYQNEICETAENHYMHEKTANYNDISDDKEVPDPYATSDNDSEYIPTEEPSDSSSNNSEMPNKHSWCEALLKNSTRKLNEKKPANRINITNRTKNIREKLATPLSSSDEDTVKVSCSEKKDGKRIRNKRYSCYFCQKIVINLSRHLISIHYNDTAVARILALPKGSKNRREEFGKLMREGNFYHNCEVLQLKKGELILLRRPTPFEQKKYTYINYGPCPDCLGFMLKKNIAFHIKNNCGIKSKVGLENRKPIGESNAMLSGMFGFNFTSEFTSNILTRMRDDEITKVCKEDQLILKFGFMMFEKYSTTQCELIRQSMRQIGRFFKEVNKARPDIKSLSECLKPQHFDVIIQATKTLCVTNTNIAKRTEFQTPSLALKIGHALKKCISYERGNALRSGNIKRNRDLEAFLSLMDMEWSTRISSNALNTLHTRKFNCTQLLPITSDLIKLNNYLECEMKKHKTEIEKTYQPSLSCWSRFASLMLSKIVVFNKRRSGETSRMTLEQYSMRPLWSEQTTEESKSAMTQFEKQLAEHFAVVEVPGKRDLPHIELEDGEEVDENAVREDKPNNVPFSEEESTPNNIEEENVPNTVTNKKSLKSSSIKKEPITNDHIDDDASIQSNDEPYQSSCSEYVPSSYSSSHEGDEDDYANLRKEFQIPDNSSDSEIETTAYVNRAKKTISGSRVYDKRHACCFCDKLTGTVTRHLQLVHFKEIEVAKLLTMDKNSERRKKEFLCLLRAGDYYNNCQILAMKKGELILSRRLSSNGRSRVLSKYGPCPNCLGFFLLTTLWRHVKNSCPNKKNICDNTSRRDVRGESYALLSSWSETNTPVEFQKDILSTLKHDDVGIEPITNDHIDDDASIQSNDEPYQSSSSEYVPSSYSSSHEGDEDDYANLRKELILANSILCDEPSTKMLSNLPVSPLELACQLQEVPKSMKSLVFPLQICDKFQIPDNSSDSEIETTAYVNRAKKTISGSRVYDKRHACYFCDKLIGTVTRHLELVHFKEIEVAKLLTMDKNSERRKEGFLCLLRAGDYYHNCQILAMKKGELILSRRFSSKGRSRGLSNYGPCPN
ncbi:hypothetical protein RN001_007876 [Aquatica leii]|uniref:Uncharacterized protein n=1 Tax=Aquatica leii TaxID=1421715 RepID=A0AAN7P3H2_9COLE|nr:hypothetical protein RN001_007876 [Aquatica leii]